MILKRFFGKVLVVGGGPVGLTFANALACSPYFAQPSSIVVLEASQTGESKLPDQPSQRVYSINRSTQNVWTSIESWNKLEEQRLGVAKGMQVWDDASSFSIKVPQLSHMIQNGNIVNSLLKLASQKPSIKIIGGQEIVSLEEKKNTVTARSLKGNQFQGVTVVLADGKSNKLKDSVGLYSYGWDYCQKAIACTLKMSHSHSLAYQRFSQHSILGLLPLWDDYYSFVWSVQLPLFQNLMKKSDQQFKQALNEFIHTNLPAGMQQPPVVLQIINKRMTFQLKFSQAHQYCKGRIALIGDSAHTIHPLAGLGVNNGIADAVILANKMIEQARAGHDIGEPIGLKRYQREAKLVNYSSGLAIQSFKHFFTSSRLSGLRKTLINIFDGQEKAKGLSVSLGSQNPFFPQRFEWRSN